MKSEPAQTMKMLQQRVEHLLELQKHSPRNRILIAMAGVPGSGKSTISDALIQDLARKGIPNVAVLPMDGFHYSRATLSSFADPDEAMRRRGAPFTFDADGFVAIVSLLRATPVTLQEPEITITAPSFDHATKDPVANGITISSRTQVVIIEGNYTLLDCRPWNKIHKLVDDRWFVNVSTDIVRERLVLRHLQAGIETTKEAALSRAEENDLANGEYIKSHLIKPDVQIHNLSA